MSAENWTYRAGGPGRRAEGGAGESGQLTLEQRLERELPALLQLARRLARDDEDAREAVQDTLERAWRARTQLRDPQATGGWLRSILARVLVDNHRRRREEPSGAPTELAELLLPDVQDPAAVVGAAEDERAMRAALRRLPPEDRLALVLHDGEGFAAAEVAELLGVGVEAAHKRIQRARVRLVAALADPGATRPPTGACATTRAQAHALLDGSLGEAQRERIEHHLETCPNCPAALQAVSGVMAALARLEHDEQASEALRARMLSRLREL